jgi:hypothetical protein
VESAKRSLPRIGTGAGVLVGIDPDFDCLRYGKNQYGYIKLLKEGENH